MPQRALVLVALLAFTTLLACSAHEASTPTPAPPLTTPTTASAPAPQEPHLANVRKLTSGGENAEAYWSWGGDRLIFQRRDGERTCDRIMTMRADGSDVKLVSGDGAHTCGFFLKGDQRVIFASTRLAGPDCPPPPDRSKGYAWALHPALDIFSANADGSDVQRLTDTPGYDAEGTVSPKDGTIVFTSVRGGDLDIYTMRPDGSDVKQLTNTPGYDGGPVFSPDGSLIAYRAWHPEGQELADYQALLKEGLVRPTRLDLWLMNADGSNAHRVTDLGRASFAPAFTPDGKRLVFSSNHEDPKGREFDLYLVSLDGTGLEPVTRTPEFDGFPLFSPDGTKLAFCSNRRHDQPGETNVFVADWRD